MSFNIPTVLMIIINTNMALTSFLETGNFVKWSVLPLNHEDPIAIDIGSIAIGSFYNVNLNRK